MATKNKKENLINDSFKNLTSLDLNKTLYIKPAVIQKNQKWLLVDAEWQNLGRLATYIADKLMWKDKAYYCDFWNCGDFVVVKNADKIQVTWNKLLDKIYYKHTGWKGNMKSISLRDLLKKDPTKALWFAIRWMLPKNKLRDVRLQKLKLFVWNTTKYDNLANIKLEVA